MTITDVSSFIHDLTKAFAELSPLILVMTATILTAIAGYKRVVAASPQKNLIG